MGVGFGSMMTKSTTSSAARFDARSSWGTYGRWFALKMCSSAGSLADGLPQRFKGLDLGAVLVRGHRARNSNQVLVAAAIDVGSHTGASAQRSMSRIISATPSSNETLGLQPRRCWILLMSAHVQSASPGRLGT